MADPTAAFSKLVPGFDFLQGLVKNAGAALPSVGQWVAPTLDPEELEKKIEELRTVQFWLEQNARMLGATIQALEVQRMTLSTLKTMNVSLGDLTESLKIKLPEQPAAAPADAADADDEDGETEDEAPKPAAAKPRAARKPKAAAAPQVPPGVPDPLQWWGALTKQFTELATNAMKDSAADAAKGLAGAMVKQGFDAASETLKKAAAVPAAVAKSAASAAQQAAQQAARVAGGNGGRGASSRGAATPPAGTPPAPSSRRPATGSSSSSTGRKAGAARKRAAPR